MIKQFFGYFVDKDKQSISKIADEIQILIDNLYLNEPNNNTFEQLGFIDGSTIVKEYINEGEYGLAIEHLLYMIYESDISYPDQVIEQLNYLTSKFKVKNSYL